MERRHGITRMMLDESTTGVALDDFGGGCTGKRMGRRVKHRKCQVLKYRILLKMGHSKSASRDFISGNMPGVALEVSMVRKPF